MTEFVLRVIRAARAFTLIHSVQSTAEQREAARRELFDAVDADMRNDERAILAAKNSSREKLLAVCGTVREVKP